MEHVWSVLATKVLIDERTRLVTIIETCDALDILKSEVPDFDPKSKILIVIERIQLILTSFWVRSNYDVPETGELRYVLVTPDGKRFTQPTQPIRLEDNVSFRCMLNFDKLTFRGLGLYLLQVEQKKEGRKRWTRVAKLPLWLRAKEESPKGK